MKIRHLTTGRIQITHYGTEFSDGAVMFDERDIPTIGQTGILGISERPDGSESAWLVADHGEGLPGNTDHNIRRYHGWRGTTNGIATYAHGLRTVEAIRRTRRTIVVTLGVDQKPDEA